ncbi:MAG: hypothetical protein Q8O89_08355 [Nanoarchaeota archaeon]|nr:hypothetical protein [Nanoarchaeota archaeon]
MFDRHNEFEWRKHCNSLESLVNIFFWQNTETSTYELQRNVLQFIKSTPNIKRSIRFAGFDAPSKTLDYKTKRLVKGKDLLDLGDYGSWGPRLVKEYGVQFYFAISNTLNEAIDLEFIPRLPIARITDKGFKIYGWSPDCYALHFDYNEIRPFHKFDFIFSNAITLTQGYDFDEKKCHNQPGFIPIEKVLSHLKPGGRLIISLDLGNNYYDDSKALLNQMTPIKEDWAIRTDKDSKYRAWLSVNALYQKPLIDNNPVKTNL